MADPRALASAHMVRQVQESARIEAALALAFQKALDPYDLDRSFERYSRAATAIITAGRRQSEKIATDYFAEAWKAAEQEGEVPTATVEALDLEALATDLRVNGPALVKSKVADGVPIAEAMRLAQIATLRMGKRHVINASRDALISQTRKSGARWARVSDGNPCYFCGMLVSRGPVYTTRQTARFGAHNGCGCNVRIVFEGDSDGGWSPEAEKMKALWKATGDPSSFRSALREAYKDPESEPAKILAPAQADVVEKLFGAYARGAAKTVEDAVAKTNPRYSEDQTYRMNCVHCVNAYELRRRGYDVEAAPLPDSLVSNGGRDSKDYLARLIDPATGNPPEYARFKNQTALKTEIANAGPGARYMITVGWKRGGGHAFVAENVDGKVRFLDPQSGEADVNYFAKAKAGALFAYRMDTLDPRDNLADFVREAGS